VGCKETFNLLYMESEQDVGIQLRRPLFQKVLLHATTTDTNPYLAPYHDPSQIRKKGRQRQEDSTNVE
jgi:hypothetical protein